jgi:ubiquinone/menaquinone biosynthesis C-methylase UbiE
LSQVDARESSAGRTPDQYVDKFLDDVTLPRVIVRAAECVLLSQIEMPRPILDVGCGDGTFAAALFDKPVEVGADPWAEPLQYARKLGIYESLVVAPGDDMPFPDGAFATVLCNSTLEHTQEPWTILKEMARVTRQGGACVITVPSEYFPRYLLGSTVLQALRLGKPARLYEAFMNRVSRHVHIRPRADWQRWLEDAGFEVVASRYYFSRRNTMALDVSHYISVPSLLTKKLLGRWVLWPQKKRYLPYKQVLSRFAEPGEDEEQGAYILFHSVKK